MPDWRHDAPDPETYVAFRAVVGLGRRSVAAARIGLAGGLHCMTLWDGDRLIAMGRLVVDGGCFTQMVDIMVRPDRQGQGLGARIVERLLDWAERNLPPTCLIGLHAAPGVEPFYAARDFRPLTGLIRNVGVPA